MEYPQRNAKNQGGYSAAGQAQRRIQSFLESAELVLVRTCRPAQGANNSPWGETVVNQTRLRPVLALLASILSPLALRLRSYLIPEAPSRTLPRNQPCAPFTQALAE